MRSFVLTVSALIVLTRVVVCQSNPPDEKLEIKGLQLWLGMDENTVTQKLHEKNFSIVEIKSLDPGLRVWLLCDSPEGKDCDPVLGEVGFRNGHVSIATKRWTDTDDATEVVAALYGAAKDLEAHGFNHCQLATKETLHAPLSALARGYAWSAHQSRFWRR